MTVRDLGATLADMYSGAPEGDAVTMIHLFGIKYADDIRALGSNATEIVRASGLNKSYSTEVNKGMKLAKYVSVSV